MKTNYKFGEVISHDEAISYSDERVVFEPVFETSNGGVAFVALQKGQKLETHMAPFEVMVNICEGDVDFKMLDDSRNMKEGQFLLMGANVPHSVIANKDSKLMIIKIKD